MRASPSLPPILAKYFSVPMAPSTSIDASALVLPEFLRAISNHSSRRAASASAILPSSSARCAITQLAQLGTSHIAGVLQRRLQVQPFELAQATVSPVVGFTSAVPARLPACHLPPR